MVREVQSLSNWFSVILRKLNFVSVLNLIISKFTKKCLHPLCQLAICNNNSSYSYKNGFFVASLGSRN